MCKHHETGWRAISAYTGATRQEIAEAAGAGELRCRIRVRRRHLDAWRWVRELEPADPALSNEHVDLIS